MEQANYSKLVLGRITGVALLTITILVSIYFGIYKTYEMPKEYASNLASCKKEPSFTFNASPITILLSSYSIFPLGVFFGIIFRWRYKRGWSQLLVDEYNTKKY